MAMRSTPTMVSAQNIVVKNVACINGDRLKEHFMRTWIDELYLEIKSRWNRIRALPDANPDECAFLVHLMEEIEKNTDD